MKSAIRFKHTQVPRQKGELARLKVVKGPDYGAVYIALGNKVKIGRGEENDIVISDLKASRFHAEMYYQAEKWMIRDQGSANGILYNGKNVKEATLKIQDTLTIGESTLEFTTSDVGTKMLVAPPRSVDQVQLDIKNLNEQKQKVQNIFSGNQNFNSSVQSSSSGPSKRVLLYGGSGLFLFAFLMFGNENPKPAAVSNKKKNIENFNQNLASYLPNVNSSRTTETLFKEGQREYFAGNYNRGRKLFETVLQISPGHPLATLYLENSVKSVEEEVKTHLEYGKKYLDAGKLRDARSHFDRVVKLLYRDQTNPAYVEAKEQYAVVEKQIVEGGVDQ